MFSAATLSLLMGCAPGDIGTVEGVVTLDGQPLPNATLEFYPDAGGGFSAGITDDQGHYELHFGRDDMGAVIGEHLIQIRTAELGGGDYGSSEPERVPAKYNNQSELRRAVEAGHNVLDFDLDSHGELPATPRGY